MISTAPFVRGIYAHDDEAAPYLRNGWPKFETSEECDAFVRKYCASAPSNPDRPHMRQMITTLVNWQQIEKYLLGARREYNKRWPPSSSSSSALGDENLWAKSIADDEVRRRTDLPFHRHLNAFSVEKTLEYLFYHMRCGIYVMIRRNKVAMFVPFVNESFENNWGDKLAVEDDLDNKTYYDRKREQTRMRKEFVLESRFSWWANGNIMCNEHSSKGDPPEKSQLWGDRFVASLRDMLDEACRERQMPDCEFFINKRDYPQLKCHENEFPVEPYGFLTDGDDRNPSDDVALPRRFRATSLAPIVSFYCSDRFADIPWPPSEDWEAAVGTVVPPSFEHDYDSSGQLILDAKPRDLFTEAKFRQFDCDWSQKKETAFFRGTATGGGVTVEDNQRLALASLGAEWSSSSSTTATRERRRPHQKMVAEDEHLLDAALTGWNRRDKKLGAKPMTYIRQSAFGFDAGRQNFVPIFEQSRYKYLVYVEGHCAACRYGFMMRLGSVILKVESRCVADRMWFFPLLKPFVDHVPVRADLSDLADKIRWCRAHDDACRQIAANAKNLWETYVSKRGLLDYVQLVTTRIAENFDYGQVPSWLDDEVPKIRRPLPPKLVEQRPRNAQCHANGLCPRCEEEEAEEEQQKRKTRADEQPQQYPGDKRQQASGDGKDALRARMMKRRRTTNPT